MSIKMKLSVIALSLCATSVWAAPTNATPNSQANTQSANPLSFMNDRFVISGTARVRADTVKFGDEKRNTSSHLNLDTWLTARIWQDWRVKMQLEPQMNLETGKMNGDHDVPMNKLYAEGTIVGDWKARIGKYGAFSSYGRLLDNEVTGVEVAYSNPALPSKFGVARVTKHLNDNKYGAEVRRKGLVYAQTQMPVDAYTNIGATVAYLNDIKRDIPTPGNPRKEDSAWMGEIGFDTRLTSDWRFMAAYSQTDIDDVYDHTGAKVKNNGFFTQVKFKEADWNVRNSYDIFLNGRRVGAMSGVSSVEDYSKNVEGVQVGANYVPWRNLKLNAFYLHGKEVNAISPAGKRDVRAARVQAEYKF
ncbi:hypothetical protein [Wielerella bovis]|uniref:hypothetical protein n=1 Tax=Wielerella bovis TaxID=2917790 RepID=UPI002018747B|nr:hypothetical protein [Wielerella bovis]ULJ59556.1 hypothetical protein MIS44_07585 [Wielerella bovis]